MLICALLYINNYVDTIITISDLNILETVRFIVITIFIFPNYLQIFSYKQHILSRFCGILSSLL